jgi:uncharacterized repeat protein (TIGR01451 family)
MKKIIVGFIAFALLLGAHSAFAAGWNQYPSDCPVPLAIGNYTTGDGIRNGSSGCWTQTSVTMQPGQVINIDIFYDNTTGADAGNTVIHLTQSPAGSMSNTNSTYTFSGNLTSSNGSLPLGSATANIASPQTVTFAKAKLFPHGSSTGIDLPGGQSGFEAFGSGLNLGTIAKDDWGNIVMSFNVGTSSVQVCQDTSASNYNVSYPCQYPQQLCKDYNASNYNGSLPCQYPQQLCKDPSASNYNGSLPCQYPQPQLCRDTSALNYNGSLPCQYPQLCRDVNAINYNGILPCQYPQLCRDPNAINYNGALPCQFPAPVITSCAVTTVVTNITTTSATLHGMVTGGSNEVFFEYGPTVSLGTRTPARAGNGEFNETVSGLSSKTVYYYRIVARCGSVLSYGKIDIFQTDGVPTPQVKGVTIKRTVVSKPKVLGVTVSGSECPIALNITDKYQQVGVGDIVDYTITYQNITNMMLARPLFQVVVPKGFTIINSSVGTFSSDTNTVTAQLADLHPGEGGVAYIQARVDSLAADNFQIVSTAIVVYTTEKGAQQNAIAYVINNPKMSGSSSTVGGNALGSAAAFGSSGILPGTLLGWLLLIILILIIVLISTRFTRRTTHVTTVPGPGGSTTTRTEEMHHY